MEPIMQIIFKKGKKTKSYRTKGETTVKTVRELMEKNGWQYVRTQYLLNI